MPGKKPPGGQPRPSVKWCVSLLNTFERHMFELLKDTPEGIPKKNFWELFQKKHDYSLYPPHLKSPFVLSEFLIQFPHLLKLYTEPETSVEMVSLTEDAATNGKTGLSTALLTQCQHRRICIEQETKMAEIHTNAIRMMCNHPDGIALSKFWPEYYKVYPNSESNVLHTLGPLSPMATIKKYFDDYLYIENDLVQLRDGVDWMVPGPSAQSTSTGLIMETVRGATIEATRVVKTTLSKLVQLSIEQIDGVTKDIIEETTKVFADSLNGSLSSLPMDNAENGMETEDKTEDCEEKSHINLNEQVRGVFAKLTDDDLRLIDAEIKRKNSLLGICLEKETKQAIATFTTNVQETRKAMTLDFTKAISSTVIEAFPALENCPDAVVGGPALYALMEQRVSTVLENYPDGITFDEFCEKHGDIFEVSNHPMRSINFFLPKYHNMVDFKSDSGKVLIFKKSSETKKEKDDEPTKIESVEEEEKSSEDVADKTEWKKIRQQVAQEMVEMVKQRPYSILLQNIFVEYYIFYGKVVPKHCNKPWTVLQNSEKKLIKRMENGQVFVALSEDANNSESQLDISAHEMAEAVCKTEDVPQEQITPADRRNHWDELKINLPILLADYPQGLPAQDLWSKYKEKFNFFPNRSILGIPKTKPVVKYFFDVIEEKLVNGFLCVFVKGKGPVEDTIVSAKSKPETKAETTPSTTSSTIPEIKTKVLDLLKGASPKGIPHQEFWSLYKRKFGQMPTRDELGIAKPKSLINAFADLTFISPVDGVPHVKLNSGAGDVTTGVKRTAEIAGFGDDVSGKGKTQKQNTGEKSTATVGQSKNKATAEKEPQVVQTMASLKKNVKQILSENPKGLTSHMLWQTYAKAYKTHPNKQQLGLNKTTSIISQLSDICEERSTAQGKLVFLKTATNRKPNVPAARQNTGRGRGKMNQQRNTEYGGTPKRTHTQGGFNNSPSQFNQSPTGHDLKQLAPFLSSLIKSKSNGQQNQGKSPRMFGRKKNEGSRDLGRGRFTGRVGANFGNRQGSGISSGNMEKIQQLAGYSVGSLNNDSYGQNINQTSSPGGYNNQGPGQLMQGMSQSGGNSGYGDVSSSYNYGANSSNYGTGNSSNYGASNSDYGSGMNFSQTQNQQQSQDYDLRKSGGSMYMQSMISNTNQGSSMLSQGAASSSVPGSSSNQWPNWQYQT